MANNDSTETIPLRTMQRMQNNFAEALGISLASYDIRGKRLTKPSNINRFYKNFIEDNQLTFPQFRRNTQNAIENCIKSGELYVYKCYCETTGFAVPIIINNKVLAVFIGGRVREGNPDLKICHTEAEKLEVDFDNFLECFLDLPLFNKHQIEAIAKLLQNIANTISLLAISGNQSKEKVEEMSYLNKLLEEEIEVRNIALQKSEKQYRNIVENALDIICTINAEGLITSINEIGTEYINLPREEILGTHYSRYIEPEDRPAIKEAMRALINGEKETIKHLRYRGLHSKRTLSINGRAMRNNQNQLIEIECVIRDITKEAKLQKKLQKAGKRYQELFNSVPDGIYACDMEGKVTGINKAGCEILGFTEDELIGMDLKSLYVYPEEREVFIEEILKKGYYNGFIAHIKHHQSGRTFYLETDSNLIKNKDGNPIAIEGVFRDVTTKIRLSRKLSESEKKFRAIFENAFDAIILCDKDGNIIEMNKKGKRLVGKNINNLNSVLNEQTAILLNSATNKEYYQIPVYSFSINKKEHHVSISISKLEIDGKVIFQFIFHDIRNIIHEKSANKLNPVFSHSKMSMNDPM